MPSRILPALLLATTLSGCVNSFPMAPERPPPPQPVAAPPQTLVQRCYAAVPQAHPWRARQIQSAILHYELSRAYHRSAAGMKPRDRERAMAQEREAWGLLWETCQPVLAGPADVPGG